MMGLCFQHSLNPQQLLFAELVCERITFYEVFMQVQQITTDVLLEKYAKGDEKTEDDIFRRVARGVASVEKDPAHWEKVFFENMKRGTMGAGRIMASAGTDIQATLINCFVQPVGDSTRGLDKDGLPGIMDAVSEAHETLRRGGGVGYNFSKIRPKNAIVKGTRSNASGPCIYIDVFDSMCKAVKSAGGRRGAQMGVLRIDHPDVQEFIGAKRTQGRWNNFNVSVFVSDEFMECESSDGVWELVHQAEPNEDLKVAGAHQREDGMWVYGVIKARELWSRIMESNHKYAEPGILFGTKMNSDNNLRYIEVIEACNPCGEQGLPNYACCDLGQSFLTRYIKSAFQPNASFDFDEFKLAVAIQVRFLDNVLDLTFWPLEQQRTEAFNKRRQGGGYTALGNALVMLNLRYNSAEGREMARRITEAMRDTAYLASVELSKERGPFPLFNADKYLEEGTFASRLPEHIKEQIRKYGIHNSHNLSLAPVGTLSLGFGDNCSNGVEPIYAPIYSRVKQMEGGGTKSYSVIDHSVRAFQSVCNEDVADSIRTAIRTFEVAGEELDKISRNEMSIGTKKQMEDIQVNSARVLRGLMPSSYVTALEMSTDDHLKMLEVLQPYIDSSISKTINVPEDTPIEAFADIYKKAWKAGLKGVTTYRPNAILGAVLSVPKATVGAPVLTQNDTPIVDFDPLKVMIDKRQDGEVESKSSKVRYSGPSGDQSLFVTVSFTQVAGVVDGKACEVERALEVFVAASPDGVPMEWVAVYARNLSLLARSGLLAKALKDNRSVRSDKGRVRYGWYEKEDGSKVPRFHDSEVACIAFAVQEILANRGLIDAAGNQVPAKVLVKRQAEKSGPVVVAELPKTEVTKVISTQAATGKKCTECGAHAVIKKDGCEFCTNCGHVGACG
jgi:ribonucleoside-diphosphate reductase alpha chain